MARSRRAGRRGPPGPEHRVLQPLPGLPQVAPLLGPALGLQAPIADHLAGVPLHPAAQLPGLVVHLVRKSHRGTSSRRGTRFRGAVTAPLPLHAARTSRQQRPVPDGDGVVRRYRRFGEVGGLLDRVLGHPERAQPAGDAVLVGQRPQPGHRVVRAQRPGHPGDRVGCTGSVERQHVRQHDGVGAGVGQVERAAEDVAELVVQPGPGDGDAEAPSHAPQAARPGRRCAGRPPAGRRPPRRRRCSPGCAAAPTCLHGVRQGVEPARRGEAGGQGGDELRVVDDDPGQHGGSVPVVLRPFSVSPQTAVTSEPA